MTGSYLVWGFVVFTVATALIQLASAFRLLREGRGASASGESVRFLVGRSLLEILVGAIVAALYQMAYLDWFWSLIVGSLFYTPLALLVYFRQKRALQR